MSRVLIPSDNPDFARYLADAYARAGWEATVGAGNFDLATARFDRIHFQWPEELSAWRPPSERRLAEITARLECWNKERGSELVLTAHNLRPHRDGRHPMYQRLLDSIYERVGTVLHFTNTSRDLVLREFPSSARAQHVVTGFFNLNHLVPGHRDPMAVRRARGFREDEFVILLFGGLREWAEVELVRDAFERAKVPGKRLLMCGRYDEPGLRWLQRWRRWKLARWLRARRAVVVHGYLPDETVHTVVDAADALIVPRRSALNSGLPALGASFGRIIIAPDCGAYPELLAGTRNLIYAPGDAADLARQIEKAAKLERAAVALENTALAEKWTWANLTGPIPPSISHPN
jgi:glycosyltransferase involved in cell wall biosynthesis